MRSQRQRGRRELSDDRILGSAGFVERILREADARTVRQHAAKNGNRNAERVVAAACKKNGVSLTEMRSGSRRGRLPAVRAEIVRGLVENYGVAIAEVARQVGISTSGASKILTRALSILSTASLVFSSARPQRCNPSLQSLSPLVNEVSDNEMRKASSVCGVRRHRRRLSSQDATGHAGHGTRASESLVGLTTAIGVAAPLAICCICLSNVRRSVTYMPPRAPSKPQFQAASTCA